MITITRHNVFETNSSSTHSLTIRNNTAIIKPDLDPSVSQLVVYPGEFGWEVITFSDIETKLSYLYTDILNYLPDNIKDWAMQHLVDCIKNNLGVDLVFEKNLNTDPFFSYENGYIDHQSVGLTLDNIWFVNDDNQTQTALFDFLFRQGSVLETDNDNR